MDWYYVLNSKRFGPINDSEFRSLVNAGRIDAKTFVWNETLEDWTLFKKVKLSKPAPGKADSSPAAETRKPDSSTGVCSQCKKTFPKEELANFSNSLICGACKPLFVQKLKEGVSTGDMIYAGFWIRFAAKLIDGIIMGVFSFAVNFVFEMGSYMAALAFIPMIVQWAINISYVTWFLGKFGATPGKMACGLKVVTAENERISYLRAFARFFAEFLSGIIFCIGYLMAAFDSEKRTLHDRICNTRVVKK